MKQLHQTHPTIHRHLSNGHFGVQMLSVNRFGKTPEEQAIEETINWHSKIPGGIIGKSRNYQAVSQWVDTTADRAQITTNIRKMTGTTSNVNSSQWTHNESLPARMKRDELDVINVATTIKNMLDPFKISEELQFQLVLKLVQRLKAKKA